MSTGEPTVQTEAAVLRAVRAGDEPALAALAERYRRQLHASGERGRGVWVDLRHSRYR
jgi:hypothetical protein